MSSSDASELGQNTLCPSMRNSTSPPKPAWPRQIVCVKNEKRLGKRDQVSLIPTWGRASVDSPSARYVIWKASGSARLYGGMVNVCETPELSQIASPSHLTSPRSSLPIAVASRTAPPDVVHGAGLSNPGASGAPANSHPLPLSSYAGAQAQTLPGHSHSNVSQMLASSTGPASSIPASSSFPSVLAAPPQPITRSTPPMRQIRVIALGWLSPTH